MIFRLSEPHTNIQPGKPETPRASDTLLSAPSKSVRLPTLLCLVLKLTDVLFALISLLPVPTEVRVVVVEDVAGDAADVVGSTVEDVVVGVGSAVVVVADEEVPEVAVVEGMHRNLSFKNSQANKFLAPIVGVLEITKARSRPLVKGLKAM